MMTHPGRVVDHQRASSRVAWIVVVHCLCIASEVFIIKHTPSAEARMSWVQTT